jgi:hypothetical protein
MTTTAIATLDPHTASMLVGAGLVAVSGSIGWFIGWISGRRHHSDRHPRPSSELICSCGHGYGTHEDEKRCHGVNKAKRNGMHVLDPCPCRQYDGPEPLLRAWTPAPQLRDVEST